MMPAQSMAHWGAVVPAKPRLPALVIRSSCVLSCQKLKPPSAPPPPLTETRENSPWPLLLFQPMQPPPFVHGAMRKLTLPIFAPALNPYGPFESTKQRGAVNPMPRAPAGVIIIRASGEPPVPVRNHILPLPSVPSPAQLPPPKSYSLMFASVLAIAVNGPAAVPKVLALAVV